MEPTQHLPALGLELPIFSPSHQVGKTLPPLYLPTDGWRLELLGVLRNLRTQVPVLGNLASSSRGSAVHPPHRTCLLLWVPCPDPDASTSASAGQNYDKSPVQLASVRGLQPGSRLFAPPAALSLVPALPGLEPV
eukprot:XP_017446787.1 PREDICTED: uncharacterized protein LOC108350053 isoform X2 [Rattus norvegicus]